MRVILDTDIPISALLSPVGAPAKLLDAWERKMFTLVASDALIAERSDVAGRPFFRARLRASAAELLVTGDKELLTLKHHRSARIIIPAAMIELLTELESGE